MVARGHLGSLATHALTLGALAALGGCEAANPTIDGDAGKPLAQLDLRGTPPQALVLLGPDEVRIREGQALAITIDGDPAVADMIRFTLKDGTLGILRKDGGWESRPTAIINVTMPAPGSLIAAGSGRIRAEGLRPEAEVTIAGSGDIETLNVAADALEVTIAGSGSYRAAGSARRLDMTIAGSGAAAMDSLQANDAKVTITGSGHSAFASDGEVSARVIGSGVVRVQGRARCRIESSGPGKVVCGPTPQVSARPTSGSPHG